MSEHIFTFGGGHRCECGHDLSSCYTVIPIADRDEARTRMFAVWGRKWSMQYPTRDEAGVERFRLSEVSANDSNPGRCRCGWGEVYGAAPKLIQVVLESPFAGDLERNARYRDLCMRDSFRRGEAPFASHRLYPGVLDDNDREERALGIEAGLIWARGARKAVVYTDLGISEGMALGIARHENEGRGIEYRTLEGWGVEPW